MSIYDKRQIAGDTFSSQRREFLKRVKGKTTQKSFDHIFKARRIEDLFKSKERLLADRKSVSEPSPTYEPGTGKRTKIFSNNDTYNKGYTEEIPKQLADGMGGGSKAGDEEGEFLFEVSKEEYLEMFFDDLELPAAFKRSLKGSKVFKRRRSGWTIDGAPHSLDLKKTFEMALARKLASRASGKKNTPYLDDVDLRYKRFENKPVPVMKGVMICLMDISGSMTDDKKLLSKKFFTLLYLFLSRMYDTIELRFVAYHSLAKEMTQEEFFNTKESGGTVISRAYDKALTIIKEYDLSDTNVYVAHCTDGENFPNDMDKCKQRMSETLNLVNYLFYLEIRTGQAWMDQVYSTIGKELVVEHDNYSQKLIREPKEIFKVFKKFFKKVTSK